MAAPGIGPGPIDLAPGPVDHLPNEKEHASDAHNERKLP